MGELSKLINIGKSVEAQLNQVGIHTRDDLIKAGSKEAWLSIKRIDDSACINRLYALEGAIQEMRWHDLPSVVKRDLKTFYNSIQECEHI